MFRKNKKITLASRISIMVIVIVIISVTISIVSIGYWSINNMKKNIERNILNVVNITKLSPIIISGLENPSSDNGQIQYFINETQNQCEDIDIMVVANNEGIRFGHTIEDRVGYMFSADDHDKAIKNGKTYVSTGPGTLGYSMRAFAPIKNKEEQIIGFVMAGSLLTSIEIAKNKMKIMTFLFLFIGSCFGVVGALYVSNIIKKSLLGFEPHDIARLYSENDAILQTVKEGIIAIDENYRITLINDRAKEISNYQDQSVLGQDIRNVFPKSQLIKVIENGLPILDYQHSLDSIIVNSNNIPIVKDNKIVGGISSFRDQTEIIKLSEEVTGIKKVVDSLRATTHEFTNKLHVILGFIELDKKKEAISYISNLNAEIQNSVTKVLDLIKDPTISALIIGKINRGNELKVNIVINDNTCFKNKYNIDINSLTVILGNLIDNSLENLDSISRSNKTINILISEKNSNIKIIIEDNGTGIENLDSIYTKGYSTKDSGLGYGLYLLKNNVDKYNGDIQVTTIINKGTKFEITI